MATRKGKTGLLGMIAFGAMILNAVSWICRSCGLEGKPISIIDAVASLSLVIVALVVAFDFADKQTKTWRIIYWVLAILTIGAILFGVGINFVK